MLVANTNPTDREVFDIELELYTKHNAMSSILLYRYVHSSYNITNKYILWLLSPRDVTIVRVVACRVSVLSQSGSCCKTSSYQYMEYVRTRHRVTNFKSKTGKLVHIIIISTMFSGIQNYIKKERGNVEYCMREVNYRARDLHPLTRTTIFFLNAEHVHK